MGGYFRRKDTIRQVILDAEWSESGVCLCGADIRALIDLLAVKPVFRKTTPQPSPAVPLAFNSMQSTLGPPFLLPQHARAAPCKPVLVALHQVVNYDSSFGK